MIRFHEDGIEARGNLPIEAGQAAAGQLYEAPAYEVVEIGGAGRVHIGDLSAGANAADGVLSSWPAGDDQEAVRYDLYGLGIGPGAQIEQLLAQLGDGVIQVRPGQTEVGSCIMLVGIPEPCRGEATDFAGGYAGGPAAVCIEPLVKLGLGETVPPDRFTMVAGVE